MPNKKLSLGMQSFSRLIENNCIYVDKTEIIHTLIEAGSYYFLSRPRRFGKSLLITTLKELFSGNKKLFKSTYIASSDYEWSEHPIVYLDFSTLSLKSPEDLELDLLRSLKKIAKHYGVEVDEDVSIPMRTVSLIEQLAPKGKVVVLIDEYDYPLVNNIDDQEKAQAYREVLRSFFTPLKYVDEHIKLVFITGITKFSKTSIFSGLNNLIDLTLDDRAAKLLGYTADEITTYFPSYLEQHAQTSNCSKEELLKAIQYWYNGYQFAWKDSSSNESLKIYNPYSVLLYLSSGNFLNYWFESGTPSFLIHLMKTQEFPIFDIQDSEVHIDEIRTCDLDKVRLLPLLWQTGYLTIKSYNSETRNYTLAFPNEEVRVSFLNHFMRYLTNTKIATLSNYALKLGKALKNNDMKQFFETLEIFFADIPYTLQLPVERYYQSIFYVILNILGLPTQTEVVTNDGRIDAVIETDTHFYIIEFKLNGTATNALQQIEDKQYHKKYLGRSKKIVLIGANFDSETRNLTEWTSKDI